MDKKFLFSMLLVVTSVWLMQYFVGGNNQGNNVTQQQVSPVGGAVKVPTLKQLHKPLALGAEFAAEKNPKHEDVVQVQTDFITATFTSFGGVLDNIEYREHLGKNKKPLKTVYHQNGYDNKQRIRQPFLLVFEKDSPYFYKFVEKKSLDDREVVVFQAKHAGWKINKMYEIYKESYQIDFSVTFEPVDKKVSTLLPRIFFAAPYVHEISNNSITYLVLNEYSQSIDKFDYSKVKGMTWYWGESHTIFGAEDKYFVHSLVEDPSKFVQRAYFSHYDAKSGVAILEGPEIKEKASWTMTFYMGPKLYDHLAFVDKKLGDILSFGWLSWLCKIILKFLDKIYQLVHNYGIAIILLSILLRLPFIPLAVFTRKKTDVYQKHQPFIQRIRTKYRGNQKMMQQELMRYHKEHDLSPAGPMIGCLPMLLQIPLLFSLYRVLSNYLDLYQAPFFGWITDLSAKDPYYVLPILMGVTTLLQQHFAPTPGADGKQKVVMGFFAIVMTVVFASFPAGLVLYWLMNNLLTAVEGYIQQRFFK